MKKLALTVVVFCLANTAFAQKKLIERIFSNEKDTTRKASFMPIPVFGYAQETGFEFGLGSIYSFYVDKTDTLNRSSNFFGAASYSTKKTYNVTLRGDAWTKRNDYHFIGELRFRNMPFNFYGIGNNTSHIDEDKLVQRMVKIQFDAEKAFAKNTYTGVSLGFENHKFTDKETGGIYSNGDILDKDGGSVFFVGVSQSYDTRNSNNYPTKGFFGRISYQYAPPIFGGENFTGSQIKVNVRNFWSLAPKIVLGVQGLYYTIQSSNTSFYLLPQMGNDEMMRGYYGGRYRDENLLAAQAEIRYRFMERLGMIVFGGAGKVFANEEKQLLKNFKPNYGIGGRYFFDPAKGLSVRLDYGVGEKRPNEKRQSGFYISFAEAF
jgi:outer membrane protein assembly factor BamA